MEVILGLGLKAELMKLEANAGLNCGVPCFQGRGGMDVLPG